MKSVKPIIGTRLSDEHLEGYVRIATGKIRPDIERLLKQELRQIPQ
jgi:hypothetical protein